MPAKLKGSTQILLCLLISNFPYMIQSKHMSPEFVTEQIAICVEKIKETFVE